MTRVPTEREATMPTMLRRERWRAARLAAVGLAACTGLFAGAGLSEPGDAGAEPNKADRVHASAFRVRAEVAAGLNADGGWAGATNEAVSIDVDHPFRLRFELEGAAQADEPRRFRLQYRRNHGDWLNVPAADFPLPEGQTPRVSVVAAEGYDHGDATTDLLAESTAPFTAGAGIDLNALSPVWSGRSERWQSEWEWPLVIRRFADGAVTNEAGDRFEFRMADAAGHPLAAGRNPELTLAVPDGLLGGTFVETPGRIGPRQAANGDLYFLMEPAETDNMLMVVKSTDGGATWAEIDGAHRPATGDLEGFAAALHGDTIHMLHQTSEHVWHHAFRTSAHPAYPDTWQVRDERVATPAAEPPVQVATLVARSDGSLVGVYGGPQKIHYQIREPDGHWGEAVKIDADRPDSLSGPQAVLGADDAVHLAYTAGNGSAWYRRINPDGRLTPRLRLADDLGTGETDVGSVLPLVYLPNTGSVLAVYRRSDGRLWSRRIGPDGEPGDAVRVSERPVVQNAVDSDQTGADVIAHEGTVHVLFIEQGSGRVLHAQSPDARQWQPASVVIDNVNAQWLRGAVLSNTSGQPVYGFVFDAGSNGGSGMNRYAEVPLTPR